MTPSAASLASTGSASPAAICASHRCTAVSCAIRRCQNDTRLDCGAQFHAGISGSSASSRLTSAANRSSNSATDAATGSVERRCGAVVTPRPTWSVTKPYTDARCPVSCATVHSGHDGTGASGAASATAARNNGPSARRAASQNSLLPWALMTVSPGAECQPE